MGTPWVGPLSLHGLMGPQGLMRPQGLMAPQDLMGTQGLIPSAPKGPRDPPQKTRDARGFEDFGGDQRVRGLGPRGAQSSGIGWGGQRVRGLGSTRPGLADNFKVRELLGDRGFEVNGPYTRTL